MGPMADVISLNRARKIRKAAQDRARAQANRALFGLTREEKAASRKEAERRSRELDGKRRDPEA